VHEQDGGRAEQQLSPLPVVAGDLFGDRLSVDDAHDDLDAPAVGLVPREAAQNGRIVSRRVGSFGLKKHFLSSKTDDLAFIVV
jgi:hypothetical protein